MATFIGNKAGYTATPVACGWAGAVFEVTCHLPLIMNIRHIGAFTNIVLVIEVEIMVGEMRVRHEIEKRGQMLSLSLSDRFAFTNKGCGGGRLYNDKKKEIIKKE